MNEYLAGAAEDVAPKLLGCELLRQLPEGCIRVRIVETEAYHELDAASHSHRGETKRNSVMFGPAGRAYVYFTYGMHNIFNIVTGNEGEGSAVLVRAVEPLENVRLIETRRARRGPDALNGPAKLCQALAIDGAMNGHNLSKPPLQLIIKPPIHSSLVEVGTRIGISRDTYQPWRFFIANNPYVSRAL